MPTPFIHVRAVPNKLITMPEPVIHNGLPRTPVVQCRDEITITCGGTAHEGAEGSPNPVQEPPDASEGIPATITRHRWKMDNMTGSDASGSGQSRYGDEFWLENWEEAGGGLSWQSVYPYRPRYYPRGEFLTDNTNRTYSRVLNFNHRYVEHMWLDLGEELSAMTVMVTGIFESFGGRGAHNVLDAGRATPVFGDITGNGRHRISDRTGGRASMLYGKKRSKTGADNRWPLKGKTIIAKHHRARRPKVLFTVFNGDKSLHGCIDPKFKSIKRGKISSKKFRYLVLGRQKNKVSRDAASDMTLFEIRIWDGALTARQIKRQASRLASIYKFNKYYN